jgi:hypothetical protein
VDKSRCRVEVDDRSLHAGFAAVLQKRWVTWLSRKTKTGGSAGGDGIQAHREASMAGDMWCDHKACIGTTRTAAKAWLPDEEECYLTILPLTGV